SPSMMEISPFPTIESFSRERIQLFLMFITPRLVPAGRLKESGKWVKFAFILGNKIISLITTLQHYNITTLQHYNITTLQHYNITTLQLCKLTMLLITPENSGLQPSIYPIINPTEVKIATAKVDKATFFNSGSNSLGSFVAITFRTCNNNNTNGTNPINAIG
ncbi:MAG: hypothetical protein RLZ33_1, partial [Bacteroidota bacterium]